MLTSEKNFKLEFNEAFEALCVLDSDLPEVDFFRKLSGLKIIAADGAALRLLDSGILPDYVVGDLDRFYTSPLSQKVDKERIVYEAEQETNDFEKSLRFAFNNGIRKILIVGFHGGLLEHTLNNWSVFMRYGKKMELCVYDKGRYMIPVYGSISFESQGEIISLIPQPNVNLSSKNLAWELNEESLSLGSREGARNLSTGSPVVLEIFSGSVALFIDARLPYCPCFR